MNGLEGTDLLPGEQVVATVSHVERLLPLVSDRPVVSVKGELICTNYSLRCIIDRGSLVDNVEEEILKDCQYIPLMTILFVIKIGREGKRKILTSLKTSKKPLEEIEIITKDFKRIRYRMSNCDKRQATSMVNTIVLYSQPQSFSKLFVHDFTKHSKSNSKESHIPSFMAIQDWENELLRLKVHGWRITLANHDFQLSSTYPPFVAVPEGTTEANLKYLKECHEKGRFPVWSWSHPENGAVLLTGSCFKNDSESIPTDASYLFTISMAKQESQQVDCKAVKPIFLTKECGTVKDVQTSFSKLLELVVPCTISDLAANDKKWLSQLESTKWMELVRSCLQTADMVAQTLANESQPVLLYEVEGRDLTCVVSSLAQLIMDPHFRTVAGFQTLIQKEWVAMGHPFASRLRMVIKDEAVMFAPVFLLFLDCVKQLVHQFLSAFEFSETFLIRLYDAAISGQFCTFLFDSPGDYFAVRMPYKSEDESAQITNYYQLLPQAWGRWIDNLSEEEKERCYNPFYFFFTSRLPKIPIAEASNLPIDHGRFSAVLDAASNDCSYGGSLGLYSKSKKYVQLEKTEDQVHTDADSEPKAMGDKSTYQSDNWDMAPLLTATRLHPQTMQCNMKFWSGVFFRHIPISNEPFQEVLRVEDLKSQMVKEARRYKDSLKEHEFKRSSFRHTMFDFDDDTSLLPFSATDSNYSLQSRKRSGSDTNEEERLGMNSSKDGANHSPPKPPRPAGHSPLIKTSVSVQEKDGRMHIKSGKNVFGKKSLTSEGTALELVHMTKIPQNDARPVNFPSDVSPIMNSKRRISTNSRSSWQIESEEINEL